MATKAPEDHKPKQSELLAASARKPPEGADLLREPIDVSMAEEVEFSALLSKVKFRGETTTMNAANLLAIGGAIRYVQENFATESAAFQSWSKQGPLEVRIGKVLSLLVWYAARLGEDESSSS